MRIIILTGFMTFAITIQYAFAESWCDRDMAVAISLAKDSCILEGIKSEMFRYEN